MKTYVLMMLGIAIFHHDTLVSMTSEKNSTKIVDAATEINEIYTIYINTKNLDPQHVCDYFNTHQYKNPDTIDAITKFAHAFDSEKVKKMHPQTHNKNSHGNQPSLDLQMELLKNAIQQITTEIDDKNQAITKELNAIPGSLRARYLDALIFTIPGFLIDMSLTWMLTKYFSPKSNFFSWESATTWLTQKMLLAITLIGLTVMKQYSLSQHWLMGSILRSPFSLIGLCNIRNLVCPPAPDMDSYIPETEIASVIEAPTGRIMHQYEYTDKSTQICIQQYKKLNTLVLPRLNNIHILLQQKQQRQRQKLFQMLNTPPKASNISFNFQ